MAREGEGVQGRVQTPRLYTPVAVCTVFHERSARVLPARSAPLEQRCLPSTDLKECSWGSAFAGPCTAEREAKRELDFPKSEPDSSGPFSCPLLAPLSQNSVRTPFPFSQVKGEC